MIENIINMLEHCTKFVNGICALGKKYVDFKQINKILCFLPRECDMKIMINFEKRLDLIQLTTFMIL